MGRSGWTVAHGNAADLCITRDWPGAVEHCEAALRLARRRGDRDGEAFAVAELALAQLGISDWDTAETRCRELLAAPGAGARTTGDGLVCALLQFAGRRGQIDQARHWLAAITNWKDDSDVEHRTMYGSAVATLALADGNPAGALAKAKAVLDPRRLF